MDYKNIYDNVSHIDLGEKINELQDTNSKLLEHIKKLENDVEKLCQEILNMKTEKDALSKNISELFKTAKREIERKDVTIADLRKQLDDLLFRRRNINDNKFMGKSRSPVRHRSRSPSFHRSYNRNKSPKQRYVRSKHRDNRRKSHSRSPKRKFSNKDSSLCDSNSRTKRNRSRSNSPRKRQVYITIKEKETSTKYNNEHSNNIKLEDVKQNEINIQNIKNDVNPNEIKIQKCNNFLQEINDFNCEKVIDLSSDNSPPPVQIPQKSVFTRRAQLKNDNTNVENLSSKICNNSQTIQNIGKIENSDHSNNFDSQIDIESGDKKIEKDNKTVKIEKDTDSMKIEKNTDNIKSEKNNGNDGFTPENQIDSKSNFSSETVSEGCQRPKRRRCILRIKE